MTGGPVTMPWLGDVAGVLEAWYPGEDYGDAVTRLLFGAANPSGRLPITFPASEKQLATAPSADMWPGDSAHIEYRERLLMGYRHYDAKAIAPLFPFGFGLSYGTKFVYDDLRVARSGDAVTLRFGVRNAGTRAGAAVPQAYVGLPGAGEPPRTLQAFDKIELAPGEKRDVSFVLDRRAFSYWNDGWTVAPGCKRIDIGESSR